MGDHLPFVDLGTDAVVVALSAGNEHTCVVLSYEAIKCWGHGYWGKLGYGNAEAYGNNVNEMGDHLPFVDLGTGVSATAVSAGWEHTCALLLTNEIKCWGLNDHGQLGLGHTDTLGDQSGEMGDNLATVDLGTGRRAVAVSAGGGRGAPRRTFRTGTAQRPMSRPAATASSLMATPATTAVATRAWCSTTAS